jgi:hypothetical protein
MKCWPRYTGNEFSLTGVVCSAEITEKGIDLAKEGLAGPSATWTYLISDNPFGDALQRLLRGLKRCLVAESDDD